MDFKFYLNNNPRVTGFITGWIRDYLDGIHDVPIFIYDIDILEYQVNFCQIYWTGRTTFVSKCSTVVKYKVLSEGLEYVTQKQDGTIAEVTQSFHNQNYSTIHINTGQLPSGINRSDFDKWRSSYWKNRVTDFME